MNYDAARAAGAYTTVSLETTVNTASPHQLTLMLLDGAIRAVRLAGTDLQEGRVAEKGERIGQAMAILDELIGSLNHEVGGEIASNLEALYAYISNRLLDASLHGRQDGFDEALGLLGSLRETWVAIETPRERSAPSDVRREGGSASYGKA